MDETYLEVLEFPKILARLADHTSFSASRELARRLRPTDSLTEARTRQQETREARAFISTSPMTVGGARDVRPLVERAERRAMLLPGELLDIRQTLVAGRSLRRALLRGGGQWPRLAEVASRIEECTHVAAAIAQSIDDKGEVLDSASPRLGQIRRDLRIAHDRLLNRLEALVASPEVATYLQEPLVTQRQGRYVIPLKAQFKGRIPGLVHDQSASGATLFIEPLATVELNNRWRELQLEEEQEIDRILLELTDLVADESAYIRQTVETLAQLDLAFARARYAEAIKGVEPQLVPFRSPTAKRKAPAHPGSVIELREARHPLLDPDTVVPINVYLDDETFVLVITGPNTGGKTVSLKTVGLLAAMAQAGMAIPAAAGSRLTVFSGIYADIGDEQSIEQSLSTFSSHMGRIIRILEQADGRSLVLLDELGAGTDPVEGSALARALLTHLVERRITTLATTHYSELKIYAHQTVGVQNASVEFDLETLAPTFELTIGLPGRSNAFAIAGRLGLDENIISEARNLVAPETLETEGLLAQIKSAQKETLKARQAAQREKEEAEALRRDLAERLADIERARREVLNRAREEAAREIEEARRELARLRRLRSRLGEQKAALPEEDEETEERLERLTQRLKPIQARPAQPQLAEPEVGDHVWVAGLRQAGEITDVDGQEAEVQVGSFRVRVPVGELEGRAEPATAYPSQTPSVQFHQAASAPPPMELHCRGLTTEEVVERLDRYLDQAFLAGLPQVRIVHGKGTGALRRAVREELARHPLVSAFRPGAPHEGGDGATVAELARNK